MLTGRVTGLCAGGTFSGVFNNIVTQGRNRISFGLITAASAIFTGGKAVLCAGGLNLFFARYDIMTERTHFFKPSDNNAADGATQALFSSRGGAGCGNGFFCFCGMAVFLNKGINFHIVTDGAGMLCVSTLGAGRFNNRVNICMLMGGTFPDSIQLQ